MQKVVGATVFLILAILAFFFVFPRRTPIEIELDALARNVYWEAAVVKTEPLEGLYMVAHVTMVRVRANKHYWGGSNVRDVVYARHQRSGGKIVCQFSWTCMAVRNKQPQLVERWNMAQRIAKEVRDGVFTPPTHLTDATYYMNPAQSGRKNICEFKTRRIPLGKVHPSSVHEFFRDPKNDSEKASLPKKAQVPECKA